MAESKTIYAVARGEYSDYGVRAIFSTKEKAEEYIRHETDPNATAEPYFIEEFELDPVTMQRTWRDAWEVAMELETGNKLRYYDRWVRRFRDETTEHTRAAETQIHNNWWIAGQGMQTVKVVSAVSYVSEEHAWKLAAEARQKWLRERAQGLK